MVNDRVGLRGRETFALINKLIERISASTARVRKGQVTYIIGNNGTGKSRILGELAEQLKQARPARTVACISNSIYDRFKHTDVGNVRYLGARTVSNAVFHAAIDRQLSRFILQAMLIDRRLFWRLCEVVGMEFSFSFGENIEEQVKRRLELSSKKGRSKKAETYKDLLSRRSIGMLERISAHVGRFDHLTDAQIPVFLRYLDLNIDVSLSVHLTDGRVIGFSDLSTGEQNRTLLFAKILSSMKDRTVFLIDEPEISLHLHWQMEFHRTLMDLLSGLRHFHVVIATHAPIVISEAAKFDPNNQLNVVAVLRRRLGKDAIAVAPGPGSAPVTYDVHTFAEVASHEQLVLRYFQTAPYNAHEVSVEIADAILRVAEDVKKNKRAAVKLLQELRNAVGLSDEARAQIDSAINLIMDKLVPSIQRGLMPSMMEHD